MSDTYEDVTIAVHEQVTDRKIFFEKSFLLLERN